jgi:hypothetical protein
MKDIFPSVNTHLKPGLFMTVLAGLLCCSCTTTFEPAKLLELPAQMRQPPAPPPPVPDSQRTDAGQARNSTRAEQVIPEVSPEHVDQLQSRVRQIPADRDGASALKHPIEVDDPCLGELAETDRCKSHLVPSASLTTPDGRSDQTLTIVAPGSQAITGFDPARAANEIGRGRTVSQAAQSTGNSFLNPTNSAPSNPLPVDEDIPIESGINGLPLTVLVPNGPQ